MSYDQWREINITTAPEARLVCELLLSQTIAGDGDVLYREKIQTEDGSMYTLQTDNINHLYAVVIGTKREMLFFLNSIL